MLVRKMLPRIAYNAATLYCLCLVALLVFVFYPSPFDSKAPLSEVSALGKIDWSSVSQFNSGSSPVPGDSEPSQLKAFLPTWEQKMSSKTPLAAVEKEFRLLPWSGGQPATLAFEVPLPQQEVVLHSIQPFGEYIWVLLDESRVPLNWGSSIRESSISQSFVNSDWQMQCGEMSFCLSVKQNQDRTNRSLVVLISGHHIGRSVLVMEPGDFGKEARLWSSFYSSVLSFLALMLLLSLFLRTQISMPALDFYCLYVASIISVIFVNSGFIRPHMPYFSAILLERIAATLYFLFCVFYSSFVSIMLKELLAEKEKLKKILSIYVWLCGSCAIVSTLADPYKMKPLFFSATLICIFGSFALLCYGKFKGNKEASRLLLAQIPFLLGVISMLNYVGVINIGKLGSVLFYITFPLEAIGFGAALAFKLADSWKEAADMRAALEKANADRLAARLEQMGYASVRLADALGSPLQVLTAALESLSTEKKPTSSSLSMMERSLDAISSKLQEFKSFRQYAPSDSLQVELKDSALSFDSRPKSDETA